MPRKQSKSKQKKEPQRDDSTGEDKNAEADREPSLPKGAASPQPPAAASTSPVNVSVVHKPEPLGPERTTTLMTPPAHLEGLVVKGFGRGSKTLGFPTANIDLRDVSPETLARLAGGIYFGWAQVRGVPF